MSQAKASPASASNSNAAPKPKRQYRTADQWREIVEAFQRSRLTCSEFCKQQGIATSGLYNWQRKFERDILSAKDNGSTFVEIQPPPDGAAAISQAWDVELELGQGRVLRVRIA